jgi:hypothetical protein
MATKRFKVLTEKLKARNIPFERIDGQTVSINKELYDRDLHYALIANYMFEVSESLVFIKTL